MEQKGFQTQTGPWRQRGAGGGWVGRSREQRQLEGVRSFWVLQRVPEAPAPPPHSPKQAHQWGPGEDCW